MLASGLGLELQDAACRHLLRFWLQAYPVKVLAGLGKGPVRIPLLRSCLRPQVLIYPVTLHYRLDLLVTFIVVAV